jgi:hypothetical protein
MTWVGLKECSNPMHASPTTIYVVEFSRCAVEQRKPTPLCSSHGPEGTLWCSEPQHPDLRGSDASPKPGSTMKPDYPDSASQMVLATASVLNSGGTQHICFRITAMDRLVPWHRRPTVAIAQGSSHSHGCQGPRVDLAQHVPVGCSTEAVPSLSRVGSFHRTCACTAPT